MLNYLKNRLSLKKFISDYLNFTRKERIGVLTLIFLLLLVFFFPSFKSLLTSRKVPAIDTSWMQAMKKLEEKSQPEMKKEDQNISSANSEKTGLEYDKTITTTASLFYFDPNTISVNEWRRLGIRDKTIQTIQNYLAKGGIFKKPEDLQKVYGLRQIEYNRLAPYIKIDKKEERVVIEKPAFEKRKEENFNPRIPHYTLIDINLSDTTGFIVLPGIGSKLASRIINFREKLGGFYNVDQVKEIYGLQDSVFQKIKPYLKLENKSVKKININIATKDELKVHPYIKWNIANAIIEYRNQHGNFVNLEDLKKIQVINEEIFDKLSNYITL